MFFIHQFFQRQIFKRLKKAQRGCLTIQLPDGKKYEFGFGKEELRVFCQIKHLKFFSYLALRGQIGLLEAYKNQLLDTDNLLTLLEWCICNKEDMMGVDRGMYISRWVSRWFYAFQKNTLKRSRKNIHHHYDLGNSFYSLWLDNTMTYSSALFETEDSSLESAQIKKYDRIVEKIKCSSGSVLEIGCGWGGFIKRLLDTTDMQAKGITLSEEQLRWAQTKVVDKRARFCLEDYRLQEGSYDAIVSIEMIEAVGEEYLPVYFSTIQKLLKRGGKCVIQAILIPDENYQSYVQSTDVIRSYVFPGGFLPCMKNLQEYLSECHLKITDVYRFGQDYSKTLKKWLDRFNQIKGTLDSSQYGEEFVRIWQFYLALCYGAFKYGRTDVCQIQIEHVEE